MVIPIIPKATVGELAPRRTFRGRMAANRRLRGVAIVAALVVLAATLLGGRALQEKFGAEQEWIASALPRLLDTIRAGDTAPLPVVVVAEASGSTAAVGDTTVAGLREFFPGEGVTGANRTSGTAAETGRQEYLAGEGSTRSLPSVSTAGADRQRADLYAIEVRDSGAGPTTPSYTYDDEGVTQRGAGTTGGNSESCAYPVGLCDR